MTPYKGYTAIVWFEPDDRLFHGHLEGIRDVIHFAGATVDELEQAFRDSVDDYLAWAEEDGFEPQKPDSGDIAVRTTPDRHRLIRTAAEAERRNIDDWAADVLTRAALETLRRAG